MRAPVTATVMLTAMMFPIAAFSGDPYNGPKAAVVFHSMSHSLDVDRDSDKSSLAGEYSDSLTMSGSGFRLGRMNREESSVTSLYFEFISADEAEFDLADDITAELGNTILFGGSLGHAFFPHMIYASLGLGVTYFNYTVEDTIDLTDDYAPGLAIGIGYSGTLSDVWSFFAEYRRISMSGEYERTELLSGDTTEEHDLELELDHLSAGFRASF
ncbi:hypothetical protein LRD18_11250 [Halorhodospira halochloris]|uniref:outer membrane protein n=1 Tax=Halorhodospira halochloris TaxID=1052 RepID=UPI001EE985FA|nr:hypothetical protein [Halorhodospira halochloris]MCG5531421.1 hypothetical protein [Halorhodospira halochloris]